MASALVVPPEFPEGYGRLHQLQAIGIASAGTDVKPTSIRQIEAMRRYHLPEVIAAKRLKTCHELSQPI